MKIKHAIIGAISALADNKIAVTMILEDKIEGGAYDKQHKVCSVTLYRDSYHHKQFITTLGLSNTKDWINKPVMVALQERGEHYNFVELVDNMSPKRFEVKRCQHLPQYFMQTASLVHSSHFIPNPYCAALGGQQFFLQGKLV